MDRENCLFDDGQSFFVPVCIRLKASRMDKGRDGVWNWS